MTASTATNPVPDPRSVSAPIAIGRRLVPLLEATLQRLAAFGDLEQDWDSYGGAPPTTIALTEAGRWIEIVADLFGARVEDASIPYSVAPLANGGVQLEWRGRNGIVELEVGSGGDLAYLFLPKGEDSNGAEESDDASWSDVLRKLMRALV
jgi:hypothetical protein